MDLLEELEDVDVSLQVLGPGSLESITASARRLRDVGSLVDVLINNAGICDVPERRETVDGLELLIGINHFGPHLLTRFMEPIIADGGRMVFLVSGP